MRCRLHVEALEDRFLPSTFTVFNLNDSGAGSLRQAVFDANANPGADVIDFALGVTGTISLTGGQVTITDDLQIDGPGASQIAVSGNDASRVFGISAGTTFTLAGLTITGGLATHGAGILNTGNLTLANDVLSGNVAQGTAGGGNAFGGAVYNDAGAVSIDQSVLSGNRAVAGNGGSVGVAVTLPGGASATLLGVAGGGAIWNDGGSVAVSNSTLSNNLAQGAILATPPVTRRRLKSSAPPSAARSAAALSLQQGRPRSPSAAAR
jgi:hypothetical protein